MLLRGFIGLVIRSSSALFKHQSDQNAAFEFDTNHRSLRARVASYAHGDFKVLTKGMAV